MQTAFRQRGISLRDAIPAARFFGVQDIRVTSCCSNARQIQPGDLYVAIEGPADDGHAAVDEAIRNGAAAVLSERFLPLQRPFCVVPDTREAFGHLCQRLAGDPTETLRTVGITGTNGKTIVARLTASIFKAAGEDTGSMDSISYHDGFADEYGPRNHPTPTELAEWLSRMKANGCSTAVLELSGKALSQKRTAGLLLDAAIITNIRRGHRDDHGTLANCRRAKARILEHLKPQGVAIVNADDRASQFLLDEIDRPTITFGIHREADVTATVVERHAGEMTFLLTAGNETAAVQTRLFGDHVVYDCLAAAAAGLHSGMDLTTIARGLECVSLIPGRMEPIIAGQPFGVYVDSARSPDTLAANLKALRQVTNGRVICVFGAEGAADPEQRPLLGRVVERYADLGIITNNDPGWEEPLQIAHDILDGYERPARSHILPGRAEAIRWALSEACAGDTVLIAGKGDRNTETIRGRTFHFDDCEIAHQWLHEACLAIDDEVPSDMIIPFRQASEAVN